MRTGAYPGSFNPPTIAHLAIAEAAWRQGRLDRLDLILSRVALGKADLAWPSLQERLGVLRAVARDRPWLGVKLTDHQLLVDIAAGYDVLVVGADKWAQVLDPSWYGGSEQARDEAVARLPEVLVAPREGPAEPDAAPRRLAGAAGPLPGVAVLALDARFRTISSTAVRRGRLDWMLPEAADLDARTGCWSMPAPGERN